MEQSPKQIGTIKSLSHDLVASIAPEETPFFDELFAAAQAITEKRALTAMKQCLAFSVLAKSARTAATD